MDTAFCLSNPFFSTYAPIKTLLNSVQVPFFSLQAVHDTLGESLFQKINHVIENKEFILNKDVAAFEEEYAAFSQTKFCVGTGNGLDALKICLKCLNIGEGDEVIVPAHTYIASVLAVLEAGATPILVEPDKSTYNLDVGAVEKAITPQTKAIMAVHLYGQPCNMDAIEKLAKKYTIYIVEDNAQAQGAGFNGRPTGSIGHINATSFYPTKNLGAMGDAGAITTNDSALAEKARLLRNVGCSAKYHHEVIGYNSRLDTLQAAILSCKLPYLNEWNAERKKAAGRYMENLKYCRTITLPGLATGAQHVYHLFVIRHAKRDALQQHLLQNGIQTLIHYPIPNHMQQALKKTGYKKGDFPVTEEISATCLSLPLFIGITAEQIDYVCEKIISFENSLSV